MNITLNFSPEKQAALERLAAAAGTDLASYIQAVVQDRLEKSDSATSRKVPYEKWRKDFHEWLSRQESRNPNFDDSRESIYD